MINAAPSSPPRVIALPESGIIDIHKLAMEIFSGAVTPKKLPRDVYFYNANILKKGVYTGYKMTMSHVQYLSPDYKLLSSLRNNIYIFSAAKTFQQTVAMTKELVDGTSVRSFKDFQAAVEQISGEYNKTWLRTEYDTAIAQSQSASAWSRIEEQKAVLPIARYVATDDENTCDICGPLNDLTARVDDPIWDMFAPSNHFNCRCYLETYEEDEYDLSTDDHMTTLKEDVGGKMSPMFKMNPGRSGEVFDKSHPYFSIPKSYKDFGKQNFGLPIPEYD